MKHTIACVLTLLVALLSGSSTSYTNHTDDNFGGFKSIRPAYGADGPPGSEKGTFSAHEPKGSRPPGMPVPHYPAFAKKELHVPDQLRLVVFAPHPDDETLSSAGLIQRVLAKGGQVRVVFITNGDGYLDGVRCELGRRETSSHDFIEYGKQRHAEALQALCEMGLPAGDGIFLGFPDDGIDDLLNGHWSRSKPYISPHTGLDHPQYKKCISQGTKYTASDLKEEISSILLGFMPDWVVLPDPRDTHPDHCATGILVLDSLRKLRQNGDPSFADVQAFTYLVHYFDYPSSTKWISEINRSGVGGSKIACRVLSQTQWFSLPITSEELAVKRLALLAHRTQFEPLDYLLKLFLIRYEVFGRLEPSQIMSVPGEYAAHSGRPGS